VNENNGKERDGWRGKRKAGHRGYGLQTEAMVYGSGFVGCMCLREHRAHRRDGTPDAARSPCDAPAVGRRARGRCQRLVGVVLEGGQVAVRDRR